MWACKYRIHCFTSLCIVLNKGVLNILSLQNWLHQGRDGASLIHMVCWYILCCYILLWFWNSSSWCFTVCFLISSNTHQYQWTHTIWHTDSETNHPLAHVNLQTDKTFAHTNMHTETSCCAGFGDNHCSAGERVIWQQWEKLLSTCPFPTHTHHTHIGLSPPLFPTHSPYILTWLWEPISQSHLAASVRWLDQGTLAVGWGYTRPCSDNNSLSFPLALSFLSPALQFTDSVSHLLSC